MRPPILLLAPCGWTWTRTQVEWNSAISPSKAAETAASSRSHTPGLRQRTNRLQQIVEGPYLRPRRASPEMPKNAVQHPPAINAGNAAWLVRQQRLNDRPSPRPTIRIATVPQCRPASTARESLNHAARETSRPSMSLPPRTLTRRLAPSHPTNAPRFILLLKQPFGRGRH